MRIISVKLKAIVTADGITDMGTHVQIEDVYEVDLDQRKVLIWGHVDRPDLRVPRESIFVLPSPTGGAGWMPTELFDLTPKGASDGNTV